VIFEHEENLDERARAKRYVPKVSDYASMSCGDRYISDEDTSIWDPSSIDTSVVDTKGPKLGLGSKWGFPSYIGDAGWLWHGRGG